MYTFFEDIKTKSKRFDKWMELLDWLFSPRFEGDKWNKNYVAQYTREISKELSLDKKNCQMDALKNLHFSSKRSHTDIAMYFSGDSKGKDLLRHIRNGIAHCNAEVFYQNGRLYLVSAD